jgi:hypothetical protein
MTDPTLPRSPPPPGDMLPIEDAVAPQAYVPRWPNGDAKARPFWNDVERSMVARTDELIAESRARKGTSHDAA